MMVKTICKEMGKRQKHFPWLKTFTKEYLVKYPNCKEILQYLIENIEKEVEEVKNEHKQKTRTLFETVSDLYLHFWWKIRWKKNSQWENYWNADCTHPYHSSEIIKCFGRLLKFLIYLGIILSRGIPDSLWINRVLQVINILPVGDEIVYDALLQLHSLKKKYRNSYVEILRQILCSEIILNISEPTVYIKSLMLFRRLKNFTEDKVAKATLITTASKIKSPSNLASWLSSFDISMDADKSLADQLFAKNSKQVFQKLHHVLVGSRNGENFKLKNSKLEKLKNNAKEEKDLHRMSIGLTDTLNKNNQRKKILVLHRLCNKTKNSKKNVLKATDDNVNINFVSDEVNTKSVHKTKNTQNNSKKDNLVKKTLNSRNISERHKQSKEKKKSKAKNNAIDVSKSEKVCENTKSGSKNKKSKKKKKDQETDNINIIPSNEKNDLFNLETCSYSTNFINEDSVNNNSHIECLPGSNQMFKVVSHSIFSKNNENGTRKGDENCAMKEVTLGCSMAENRNARIDADHGCAENVSNKTMHDNDLASKLPNLLANYEIYSADENEETKRDISSCPVMETVKTVLVPDTCQNDTDSFVPFNLDFWKPDNDDASQKTSVSEDCSQISGKFPYVSVTDIKKNRSSENWQSHYSNSSFYDSTAENTFAGETSRDISEMSRDSFVSSQGSQVSDKYPFVSLVDIRKTKKKHMYKNKMLNYTDSSFDDPVFRDFNDSEFSRDTCISDGGSQILDKYPCISLVDVRKSLPPNKKSDCSNSSFNDPSVENINDTDISQETCVEVSQVSIKDSNNIKKADKISLHHTNSNLNDLVSENINNSEIISDSNQNTCNSFGRKIHLIEKINDNVQNMLDENHHQTSENNQGNLKLSSDETCVPITKFQEKHLPYVKSSKMRMASEKQDNGANHQNKTNSSTRAKRNQKSFCAKKQQKKRKCNSNKGNSLVGQPREENCGQDFETSANEGAYLNELSTLLANHGDAETQEHESVSHVANVVLNHSDTQDLPQIHENYSIHEETNIVPLGFNGNQTPSHSFNSNVAKHDLSKESNQNNINNCSIETVLDEFIESELSKEHNSSDNFNSIRSSGDRLETRPESVDHVDKSTFASFRNSSNLVSANSCNYRNTPQQNNQSTTFSASSSITENRFLETEVAKSLLNIGINKNAKSNVFSTNPDHGKAATSSDNINLSSNASNFVVDCNIINDFDSRNSSGANSSVSRDNPTIRIVLNLINAKPENCSTSNSEIPYSSHCLQSSIAPCQIMSNANCSLPVRRNNGYFGEPPFIRRTVNELETPPDSESRMRIARLSRGNCSSHCIDKTNFASLSMSKSSTPKSLSQKRHQNEFSHSSEGANEWQINQLDFNSSFSSIPSLQGEHCENVLNSWNEHRRENISNCAQDNHNQKPILTISEQSASTDRNTACAKSKPKVSYRNSISNIYSDESVDDLSISTMSLLSGEETDHSLLKTTDTEISPILPSHRQNIDASRNTVKEVFRRKQASDSLTAESLPDEKLSVTGEKRKRKKLVMNAKKPKAPLKCAYNLRSKHLLTPPTKLNLYHVW